MTKIGLTILLIILSLTLLGNLVNAQSNNFRIGLQSSYYISGTPGFSIIYDLNMDTSVQGIIGLGSSTQTVEGRILNRFSRETFWNVYYFGSAGLYNKHNNTNLIGGAGVGMEYNIQSLDSNLPPILVNADIGVIFKDGFNSFVNHLRTGFHYRF